MTYKTLYIRTVFLSITDTTGELLDFFIFSMPFPLLNKFNNNMLNYKLWFFVGLILSVLKKKLIAVCYKELLREVIYYA